MNIITFGLNHKTAPIEVREKLFLNPTQQELLLSELKGNIVVLEGCVLSTCNRVEVYVRVIDLRVDIQSLIRLIFQIKKIALTKDFDKYFYVYTGDEAVRHLFQVSTGLDSLVIGEEQILGQVKSAFAKAQESGMLHRHFNILSNMAIRSGKKARSETNISFGGSSLSWAAVVKAEEIFGGNLSERTILVIGAGEMSELAVGHIQNKTFKKLYLMNRTQENAQALARRCGGEAVPFCDLKEILTEADICLCSAGAPHYLVEHDIVKRIMTGRGGRPLVFIDLSMPRNIDPNVTLVEHVRLFQIDDLKEVVDSSMKLRSQAILEVNRIIEDKLREYQVKIQKLEQADSARFGDLERSHSPSS